MSRASARVVALRAVFRTVGSVAPETAARWAETIFCTPPRHQPRSGDEAFLTTGRRFAVPSGREELAAWEWPSGRPDARTVVLVHGWGSRAGRFSTMGQALVAGGFRVVAYDAPAHGRSTGRRASLIEFAQALHSVRHAVGPVHAVVGHSLGGAAGVLALRDGLAADRAVLIAAPADVVRFSTAFADHLRIPTVARTAMRRNLEVRLNARWDDLHLPAIVRGLRAAALVVHDREDADVPFSHAEEIAAAWPGARLLATKGLGHRAVLRDPGVVEATVGFLAESA
jgi:pimeloyl-ACP methyl ester carboxylesterase